MILLSANNASTTLGAPLTSGATTIVLATGAGASFPTPASNEYFTLTLSDALTQLLFEVCWCTARTGDSLTVMRGQEGTSAKSWLIGDYAYNTLTAASENSARAFSATNAPTLPFTIPAAHLGVTQICTTTGTITLPPVSTIADGFFCVVLCASSSATITVNTNSATVNLPNGSTTTAFTLSGLAAVCQLQWSALESAWFTVATPPLGFTPVQQGGGSNQGTNKVYLGWDSGNTGRLRYQIDSTDEADLANYADVTTEAEARGAGDAATLAGAEGYTNSYAFAKTASYFSASPLVLEVPTPQGTPFYQMGTVTVPPNSVLTNFYFGTAFPSACFGVVISYGVVNPPTNGSAGAATLNNEQFQAINTVVGSGSGDGCTYFAWGI